MNHREANTIEVLTDFLDELNQDASPKFQFDYTGRIWKRGKHRHEWEIHKEAATLTARKE